MAIIKCPECRKNISSKAKACPHCGYPLPTQQVNETKSDSSEEIRDNFYIYSKHFYSSEKKRFKAFVDGHLIGVVSDKKCISCCLEKGSHVLKISKYEDGEKHTVYKGSIDIADNELVITYDPNSNIICNQDMETVKEREEKEKQFSLVHLLAQLSIVALTVMAVIDIMEYISFIGELRSTFNGSGLAIVDVLGAELTSSLTSFANEKMMPWLISIGIATVTGWFAVCKKNLIPSLICVASSFVGVIAEYSRVGRYEGHPMLVTAVSILILLLVCTDSLSSK